MGDQSQATSQQDSIQTVTSVGNSWIICRSKSHAGRIYYFNTLSGEAAWNLSDQEIEKAKTRTKILERQSGGKFEGCPEPKDPPIDNNCKSKSPQTTQIYIPSRVYNKQIINNQFTKQNIPPVVATQCSQCSSATNVDDMGVNLPVSHNCNSNVWTIPPHHQIVIAPTSSSILNQIQTSAHSPCNSMEQRVSVENTLLPLTHRFNQMQTLNAPNINSHFANGVNKKRNNNSFGHINAGSPYYNRCNRFTDSLDLRQRLTARRKSNNAWNNLNENSNYQGEGINVRGTQRIQIIKPTIADITSSDADDHWLKENAHVQGTHLILNVTPLKQQVATANTSTWYVVADTGVLLNHINLLNVIVNSDEKCQLLVPDFIMAALQTKSRANDSQLLSRAHHILQILSRQFTAGNAVMGKDPTSGSNIHDFCYKLSAQDHDVVLISNNVQWEKNNSILTLNIQELKDLLSNDVKPAKRLIDDYNIQIIIPNDINIVEEDKEIFGSKTMSVGVQFDSNKNEISETQTNSSIINFNVKNNASQAIKRTVDVGIQTSIPLSQGSLSKKINSVGVNTETCPHISNFYEKNNEQFTCDKNVADSNEIPKRKEIRLKRNLSHQAVSDDNNVEKKLFKWRRKRNASLQNANATDQKAKSYSSNSFNTEERSMGNEPGPESSRLDNITVPESTSTCYENIDGSETSSSCFIRKCQEDRVVIEETSTSGVISNSADSESMHSMKHDEHMFNRMPYEESDICKCVMFEVESPVMEEYLKMRSDEWVSRFVQIMEEVLSQILQHTPAFFNRTLPPPWTIHEATECIKKKFENDFDVKDAAFRLTNVLFKISDGRGKISMDLKPSEFMEMYSYGVYLVDALQAVVINSEDLQIASDSLAKLLSDIQDPTLDTSNTDVFMDSSNLPSADVTQTNATDTSTRKAHSDLTRAMSKPEEKELPDLKSPTSNSKIGRKYNLRSSQKKLIEDDEPTEQPVKFIRKIDIESTFFSSLNLKKKKENQVNAETPNRITTDGFIQNSLSPCKGNKISESLNNSEARNNTEAQNDKPSNEPKIIRNFSKCLEFEEKLKNTLEEAMEMDSFDNSQDYDNDYDYYDDYSHCGYDFYESEEEIDNTESYESNRENNSLVKNRTTTTVDKNGNTDFKSILHTVVNEIQETFLEVQSFCANITEELSILKTLNITLNPVRKLEIKEKAETVRYVIDTMSKSLNSILSREGSNCPNNIQNIFKEAGMHLDANKSIEYSNVISQYPRQANILLDAVNIVIEAVE